MSPHRSIVIPQSPQYVRRDPASVRTVLTQSSGIAARDLHTTNGLKRVSTRHKTVNDLSRNSVLNARPREVCAKSATIFEQHALKLVSKKRPIMFPVIQTFVPIHCVGVNWFSGQIKRNNVIYNKTLTSCCPLRV